MKAATLTITTSQYGNTPIREFAKYMQTKGVRIDSRNVTMYTAMYADVTWQRFFEKEYEDEYKMEYACSFKWREMFIPVFKYFDEILDDYTYVSMMPGEDIFVFVDDCSLEGLLNVVCEEKK